MSKVFIVRFHVIQFTRYSSLSARAVSLFILAHRSSFVKHFFQVFSNFFSKCFVSTVSRQLAYLNRTFSFCQRRKSHKKRASFEALYCYILCVIPHHRSGRSRLHFCGTPQRSFRRYPHPGKQRNCDPAGSSAVLLPLWS